MKDKFLRQKKNEDDADMHLAQKIMQNKRYSTFSQADDEYDYDDGPIKKSRKKQGGNDHKGTEKNTPAYRFSTQQERCLFCFENPKRPAHLVVAIANFTYLMLPQWEPVVPGHCCILPMQVSFIMFFLFLLCCYLRTWFICATKRRNMLS